MAMTISLKDTLRMTESKSIVVYIINPKYKQKLHATTDYMYWYWDKIILTKYSVNFTAGILFSIMSRGGS